MFCKMFNINNACNKLVIITVCAGGRSRNTQSIIWKLRKYLSVLFNQLQLMLKLNFTVKNNATHIMVFMANRLQPIHWSADAKHIGISIHICTYWIWNVVIYWCHCSCFSNCDLQTMVSSRVRGVRAALSNIN